METQKRPKILKNLRLKKRGEKSELISCIFCSIRLLQLNTELKVVNIHIS